MNQPSFFARRAFLIVTVVAVLFFPIGMGARRALLSNNNDIKDWLPSGFAETEELQQFQKHFAGEQFVVATWEGCTLGELEDRDPLAANSKLELLAQKLLPEDKANGKDPEWPFKSVLTGPRLLMEMTDPEGPLKLSQEEAVERLRGLVIGPGETPDGEPIATADRQTCLIVTLSSKGTEMKRELVGHGMIGREPGMLFQLADEVSVPQATLHLGGPPVDSVAIDEEGEKTLLRLVGLAGIVGLGLAYWCFHSIRITAMVFASGVLSAMLSLAFVWWYGLFEQYVLGTKDISGNLAPDFGTLDAVLMSMPAVVYVLGLSGAIHLINYYRDAVDHGGIPGATDRAIKMGWGPCALAAATTAVGLGSLYVSNIVPIQKFGIYSAIGVLGTLAMLFLFLPSLLELGVSKKSIRLSDKQANSLLDKPFIRNFASRLGNGIVRHNGWVTVCGLLLMVGFAIGISRVKTEIQLLKLFSPGARILADYGYLEENIGYLIPMELLIKVDQSKTRSTYEPPVGEDGQYRYTLLERLELMYRIQNRIEDMRMEKEDGDGTRTIQPVSKTVSVATFADRLDQNWGKSSAGERMIGINKERDGRNVLNKKLEESYRNGKFPGDYLSIDYDAQRELWRVSLRVAAFEDIDYGVFHAEIRKVVEPVVATYRWRDRIIEMLDEKGKSLADSHICILGLTEDDDVENLDDSLPLMLYSLLRRGGATVSFHDPNIGRLPKNAPYGLGRAKARTLNEPFLREQDLVLIASHEDVYPADKLAEYATVETIDVTEDPTTETEADEQALITTYTGAVPVVYKAQRELLNGLVKSIALAFGIIAVVMMFKLGGVTPGLLSMIPNMFPVIIVFGLMGWLGVLIDIGAMMTASVALGVAVDDTVHFLTWFRRGLTAGMDRKGAVMLAYERCGRAMTQTTIIGGLGLSVFALSSFTPTQIFGVLMLSILTAALLGDLILLPAMLAGPLGRVFKAEKKVAETEKETPPVVEKIPVRSAPSPQGAPVTMHMRRDPAHRRVEP